MKKLSQNNREQAIDLLNERLTFERAGVKLYDSILSKIEASGDPRLQPMVGQMREHRDEEKEHEEWLEEQIRTLGGDAHARTDMSQLVETEAEGLEKIILDGDNDPGHLFHALLAAELSDNAGWELLVALADEAGDYDARQQFDRRLREEQDHLVFVHRAVERFARTRVLGQELTMPTSV